MRRLLTTMAARLASRGGPQPGDSPRRHRRRHAAADSPVWTIDTADVLTDLLTRSR